MGLPKVVRVVRVEPNLLRAYARTRARVCVHPFYHIFSIIKKTTLTTLTKPAMARVFTLTIFYPFFDQP